MSRLVKTLSSKTTEQIDSGGTTNYISWERMKPYLEIAVRLKDHEQIDGVIVEEDGLKVRISHKSIKE